MDICTVFVGAASSNDPRHSWDRLVVESFVAQRRYAMARERVERYRREHPGGFHVSALERIAASLPDEN
jgi:hypothetical protein